MAVMIFCMTSLGMVCFSSLVQGWFVTRTSILDRVLLLGASIVLMYPALLTGFFLPNEQRHLGYIVGLALMLLTYLRQKAGAKFAASKEVVA